MTRARRVRAWLVRLSGLFDSGARDREMAEELESHLRMHVDDYVRAGVDQREALRLARVKLGGVAQTGEECRRRRGLPVLEDLWKDLRYGARALRKSPGFSLAAVLTLALGIGANTAIFSVVNAVLLRPLPFPDPQLLLTMRSNQSLPDLDDIKAQSQSFAALGGAVSQALDYTGDAEPLQVNAAHVNADFFSALAVPASLGRVISPDEDVYGGTRVVVLSHGFWQRHFGGAGGVVGGVMQLSGNGYTVVGVMPPGFNVPGPDTDLWVPLRVSNPVAAKFRGVHFLRTYLRLKPDVTLGQAQSEMAAIDQRLEQQYPEENKGRRRRLLSLHEYVVGDTRPALLVLFGAVGLVLLIASANFSNLLLARAATRRSELAVRAALGAGRGRLARQLVTESTMLALLGGIGGLLLALLGVRTLLALKPESLTLPAEVGIDPRVLAFTFVVALVTGGVFGLVPAFGASRVDVNEALKEGGRTSPGGAVRQRVRSLFVVSELALALVLLAGAGLLIRGFWSLRSVAPGLDTDDVLTMRIELPEARYKEIPRQTQFRRELLDRLNALPGARAAMVSELPLSGDVLTHNFTIEGRPAVAPGDEPELHVRSVGGDYFNTMGIPLREGRAPSTQDREHAPIVGVVNESFAREYFPGASPVGARIMWSRQQPPQWMTIVGVVGDVKQMGLDQPEAPAFYYSYMQSEQPWKRWMYVVVRSRADAAALARQVKEQVWSLDKQLPVTKVKPMNEVLAASVAARRFNMTLMSVFAAAALALAAVGVYGVISFSVTQRRHEIGVRMALGARAADVLRLVMWHGLKLTLVGVALGLAGAVAATRLMAGLLFGVGATDPFTFAAITALLLAVALLACLIPACRAAKVDPLIALRTE